MLFLFFYLGPIVGLIVILFSAFLMKDNRSLETHLILIRRRKWDKVRALIRIVVKEISKIICNQSFICRSQSYKQLSLQSYERNVQGLTHRRQEVN